jgi:hypothetical protein
MSQDLKRIIASVFKMGKGEALTKLEIRNLLVYNLRWFKPNDADSVIKAALASGFVQHGEEGDLIPTFDIEQLEIEVGYSPPKDLDMTNMIRPLFERLIEAIQSTGLDKREAIRSINRKADELNLLFPCAAIYVGIERGAEMSRFYSEVDNSIRFGER